MWPVCLCSDQASSENKRLKVFPTASHHLLLEVDIREFDEIRIFKIKFISKEKCTQIPQTAYTSQWVREPDWEKRWDEKSQERKVREAAIGETVTWILDQLDGGDDQYILHLWNIYWTIF